ncbi:hypothetical protein [Candidatus Ichthyocystis hellenicum]|uniref:hypothetical protein n=1 Tax=Candidatus Ichthyocystis hellenicum TaxID=1561003 RepID=UPI001112BBEA|nr:hypothetical protein [Candidatus Ichthyocystis hellenicum]
MVDCISKTAFCSPCTLLELSIKSIFGVDCRGSVDCLMQLPYYEVFGAAILVKRKRGISFSKYEPVFESSSSEMFSCKLDDFCRGYFDPTINCEKIRMLSSVTYLMEAIFFDLDVMFSESVEPELIDCSWKLNPIYQIVNSKDDVDIIRCCYERMNTILSLPEPVDAAVDLSLPVLTPSYEKENVFCYYDPLCFFPVYDPRSGSRCLSDTEILESMSFMISSVREIMFNLEDSRRRIGKKLYALSMAALLQMEKTFSEIDNIGKDELIGREKSIIGSLKLITCLRNLKDDVGKIKRTIFPAMKNCNFVPLEDMIEMFKSAESSLYKKEIMMITSLLKRKYPNLISSRRLKIDNVIKKNKKSNKDESLKKMNDEIKEMEMLMRSFS